MGWQLPLTAPSRAAPRPIRAYLGVWPSVIPFCPLRPARRGRIGRRVGDDHFLDRCARIALGGKEFQVRTSSQIPPWPSGGWLVYEMTPVLRSTAPSSCCSGVASRAMRANHNQRLRPGGTVAPRWTVRRGLTSPRGWVFTRARLAVCLWNACARPRLSAVAAPLLVCGRPAGSRGATRPPHAQRPWSGHRYR